MESVVVALWTVVGLLMQILPCAALCVTPFSQGGNDISSAWRHVFAIIAVALVPFIAIAVLPLPGYGRFLAHNLLGFCMIGTLCLYYVRAIEADTSHKIFAFVLAMCYGYAVTMLWNFMVESFDLATDPTQTYEFSTLVALALITATSFVPMSALMRYVRTLFATGIDAQVWWHMAILPAIPIVVLLLGEWLTPIGFMQPTSPLAHMATIAIVVVVWWTLRTVETLRTNTLRQSELEGALRLSAERRRMLEDHLQAERGRVRELEAEIAELGEAPARTDAPIVIATPTQATSFLAVDVRFVESLKRERIVHLVSGEPIHLSASLEQIAQELPSEQFVYCHRSIVVNLERVRSLATGELTLDDGTKLPVSRRRQAQLREQVMGRKDSGTV